MYTKQSNHAHKEHDKTLARVYKVHRRTVNDNEVPGTIHYIGGRRFVCQIIGPVMFAHCAFIFALQNIAGGDI